MFSLISFRLDGEIRMALELELELELEHVPITKLFENTGQSIFIRYLRTFLPLVRYLITV
jgi:hypothetical protein